MMKNRITGIRCKETDAFASAELDEEVGVGIAVQGRVGWGGAEPDAACVDIAFAGLGYKGGGGDVGGEG